MLTLSTNLTGVYKTVGDLKNQKPLELMLPQLKSLELRFGWLILNYSDFVTYLCNAVSFRGVWRMQKHILYTSWVINWRSITTGWFRHYQFSVKCSKKSCLSGCFNFSIRRINFLRSSLVFVVNEVLWTILLKLQNELGKGVIMHLSQQCSSFHKIIDSINHEILLDELEKKSVRGVCFKWFKSYWRGKHQCV